MTTIILLIYLASAATVVIRQKQCLYFIFGDDYIFPDTLHKDPNAKKIKVAANSIIAYIAGMPIVNTLTVLASFTIKVKGL